MRLSTALEGYWLHKRRDVSPNTYNDYNLTFTRLVEFLGDPLLKDITSESIHLFLSHLADLGLGAKTRSNAWTALSSFWTWAERELSTDHIIRSHVDRPRYHAEKPQPFIESEVRLLLGAIDHMQAWSSKRGKYVKGKRPTAARDRAIMLTLLDTGIRVSELCDLTVGDYDRRSGMLTIRKGKGNKKRVVYLGQSGQQAIWKYLAGRDVHSPQEPLFCSRTGTRLDRIAILRMVKRTGDRASVDNVHPHRFRHTFAITFLRNGGTPLELQRLLGHEKLDTVLVYVELAQTDLQSAQRRASPVDNWKL